MKGWIKVCGITSVEDGELAIDAGADAVGLNLYEGSPRALTVYDARIIAAALRNRIELVVVAVDLDIEALEELWEQIEPDALQLHGDEDDVVVSQLGTRAFKGVGLRDETDVERALRVPGDRVLIDARDDVQRGGTGRAPPEALAARVCAARPTILAGGLTPDNVAGAIASLRPAGVDVASGVESEPAVKSPERVRRFVAEARRAFEDLG